MPVFNLSGLVTDQGGKPIAGAQLRIRVTYYLLGGFEQQGFTQNFATRADGTYTTTWNTPPTWDATETVIFTVNLPVPAFQGYKIETAGQFVWHSGNGYSLPLSTTILSGGPP